MISEKSKEVHHYQIKALNGIHHWEDGRQDFFKAEISNISPGKVYSDKRIISVVKVNKLGRGIERLKGRDWNEKDIKRSKEMLDKIDQVMKRRE
ncbi:hypothetical protein Tco_0464068 [Tanacetum coccineum]